MLQLRKTEQLGLHPRVRFIGSQTASVILHLAVSALLLLDFGWVLQSTPAEPAFDPKKVARVFVPALGSRDADGGDLAAKRTRAEQGRSKNSIAFRSAASGRTGGVRVSLAGFQVLVRSDYGQELPKVLGAYKGSIGFGPCEDPTIVRRVASAPQWRLAEENSVSLDAFFAIRIMNPPNYVQWKQSAEEARRQRLDCVYALFPIEVERVLLRLVLAAAEARGGMSTIKSAEVALVSSVPAGFRVDTLNSSSTSALPF